MILDSVVNDSIDSLLSHEFNKTQAIEKILTYVNGIMDIQVGDYVKHMPYDSYAYGYVHEVTEQKARVRPMYGVDVWVDKYKLIVKSRVKE